MKMQDTVTPATVARTLHCKVVLLVGLAGGCVTQPADDGLIFLPLQAADAGTSAVSCGGHPCAFGAEVRGADGLNAQLYLSDSSFHQGLNDFVIVLSDSEHVACDLAEMFATMPAHEHMSEPSRIDAVDSGYLVEKLALTMPGQWQMTLVADAAKGFEPLTFPVDVQ